MKKYIHSLKQLKLRNLLWLSLVFCLGTKKLQAQIYTIGTGTTSSTTTGISPFSTVWEDNRIQYLYLASEMAAAGMPPSNILSIGFNITVLGNPNPTNVNISIDTTSLTTLSSLQTGLTNVFSAATLTPTIGWNAYTCSAPFVWNGTNNIVVEVCRDNSSWSSGYGVEVSSVSNLTFGYYNDGVTGCSMTSGNTTSFTSRPNIQFNTIPLTPCSGKPIAGTTTPAGPLSTCIGGASVLTTTGYTLAQNISFQWEESTNGGATWTPIFGATNNSYTATPITTTDYRMVTTCTNTGDTAIANAVTVNVPLPTYGTIPYFQNFDTWVNNCATADIPSSGSLGNIWSNGPPTGNESWRRSTQGATAGWTNTSGAYAPASMGLGSGSARFHSYGSTVGTPGNLDLYLDLSDLNLWGDKQLYFYHINALTPASLGVDSLNVFISTNGGPFIHLGSYDTAATWRRRSLPISLNTPGVDPNTPQAIIRFQGKKNLNITTNDIGIDSVLIVGPCTGSFSTGIISSPGTLCAGEFANLTTVGTSMAGGLSYQWEQSADGTTWQAAVGGSGSNTQFYTTPSLYDTIYYRMAVSCGAQTAATPSIMVPVAAPSYADVPYIQNFEDWSTPAFCGTFALPDSNWANSLPTSNNSWRKNTQGNNAPWTSATSGQYNTQPSVSGQYSARFHSAYAPGGSTAQLDLLVNCNQQPGNKQIEFHYRNDDGDDSLIVWYSIDSGFTFTAIDTLYAVPSWTEYRYPLVSNSPKTIVRFQGYSDYATNTGSDIYIDSFRIVEPCTSPIVAGTINNVVSACKNDTFLLYLTGNTQAAGLQYDWQSSPDNSTWSSTGGTSYNYFATITQPTYFRAVVTCMGSSVSDTTPVEFVDTTQFYYCYCGNGATVASGADVGNVLLESLPGSVLKLDQGTITTLTNNPSAYNTYTDYRYNAQVPVAQLYWDTTYRIAVTQINSSSFTNAQATVWIDIDHSGTFDPNEIVLQKATSSSTVPAQMVDDTFLLPNTMDTGLTGMRVQIIEGTNPSSNPCGSYTGGETEDYLVKILYPPCDGIPNAGTAIISDSSTCIGYTIFVTDTTYDKTHSSLHRVWQQSPDGFSWANIAGSSLLDQVPHVVTAKTYFRMRLICATPVKLDTSYSNVVMVDINPPVSCYCLSYANGGVKDTSDIGAFYFETFSNNVQGPHLKNPEAWRLRTDYTRQQAPDLWLDSTYSFMLYHIMRSEIHEDAKVTIFIDYDADLQYEAPQELVYTGYTRWNGYNLQGSFTIPHNALPDVPTGMRVILNNNVNANIPSDEGCGVYTSGETEDYVVVIRSLQTNVNTVHSIGHYTVFPNPTEGRVTVSFTVVKGIEDAQISVTNMMGAEVLHQEVGALQGGTTYQEHIDLTGLSAGVYMVTLQAGDQRLIRKLVVQ